MSRKKKNRGLYFKETIKKIFDYVGLVKKIVKLNKQNEKLTDLLEEKTLNEQFLMDELAICKTKLRAVNKELVELKKGK